uniref:Uncharacterized protein n=1 Tax=Ciona savignyi TaxID=51511 RepID=H2Y6I5_CIOSA
MTVMSYRFIRDLYMTSQVTNYDDFHLEDVLITGILREKMDNDSRRIVPKGHHGMGGAVRRSEVLVWHMGLARRLDVAFEARWHRIRSGMRILAYDKLLVGKQPSAALLNATLRATPTLPGMTLMDTMHEFANKWRQLRKPSGVRFSGVVTRAKPRTLPDYRGQREEEEE